MLYRRSGSVDRLPGAVPVVAVDRHGLVAEDIGNLLNAEASVDQQRGGGVASLVGDHPVESSAAGYSAPGPT